MSLYEHDGSFGICLNGQELMNTRATYSELMLGSLGVESLEKDSPNRVLIGGLGLGYTLKSVLEETGESTHVEVAELLPDVIEWNRTHLKSVNGVLLEDSRVKICNKDVQEIIQEAEPASYDAIMLDIDNGPVAMVQSGNRSLYSRKGIHALLNALTTTGRLAVWSASIDAKFEQHVKKNRAHIEMHRVKASHQAKRASYVIYIIQKTK
jgi:spermidine synthase